MKILLLASFSFLIAEFSFAEELTNYTITSDSQINTLEGDLEAKGNVVIKSNSGNFEAYSDKLSFDKDDKSLKLIGNVFVKNLKTYKSNYFDIKIIMNRSVLRAQLAI